MENCSEKAIPISAIELEKSMLVDQCEPGRVGSGANDREQIVQFPPLNDYVSVRVDVGNAVVFQD